MASKANRLAVAAAATTQRTREEVSTSVPQQVSTGRKVRVTVDLEPLDRRRLNAWCADAAEELGVPIGRAGAGDAIRALLAELHTDPELQARVIAGMRRNRA